MEKLTRSCGHCLRRDINLLSCKGCNIALYCNITCQKKNWFKHKTLCKEIQEKKKEKEVDNIYDAIHTHMLKHDKNFSFDNFEKTMSGNKIVDIVTMTDIENNLKCLKLFKSFAKTQSEEEIRIEEIMCHGQKHPLPINYNHIKIDKSPIHGKGVFATKQIPSNVVVTFYPCDAIQYPNKTQLAINVWRDGLDLELPQDESIINDYKFDLSDEIRIIGNPRRFTNTLLLGHLINDGGIDFFSGIDVEELKNTQFLQGRIFLYIQSSLKNSNCIFERNQNESIICIVTTRIIEEGEELTVSYTPSYWLGHHYGWDYKEKYPFIYDNQMIGKK